MKISTDTHSRKHTAYVRVVSKADGKSIDNVVGLDTEAGILIRFDPITKIRYSERNDFDVLDARTGKPMTSEQFAEIERGSTERSEQLVDQLLADLTSRSGFDMDSEVRGMIHRDWVEIVEKWR